MEALTTTRYEVVVNIQSVSVAIAFPCKISVSWERGV